MRSSTRSWGTEREPATSRCSPRASAMVCMVKPPDWPPLTSMVISPAGRLSRVTFTSLPGKISAMPTVPSGSRTTSTGPRTSPGPSPSRLRVPSNTPSGLKTSTWQSCWSAR